MCSCILFRFLLKVDGAWVAINITTPGVLVSGTDLPRRAGVSLLCCGLDLALTCPGQPVLNTAQLGHIRSFAVAVMDVVPLRFLVSLYFAFVGNS